MKHWLVKCWIQKPQPRHGLPSLKLHQTHPGARCMLRAQRLMCTCAVACIQQAGRKINEVFGMGTDGSSTQDMVFCEHLRSLKYNCYLPQRTIFTYAARLFKLCQNELQQQEESTLPTLQQVLISWNHNLCLTAELCFIVLISEINNISTHLNCFRELKQN